MTEKLKKGGLEHEKDEVALIKAAKEAGHNAVRNSRQHGLTIRIIKNHEIISVDPENNRKVVGKVRKAEHDFSGLKKGDKLVRRKT